MPPDRVKAWVESLPEAALTSGARVVLDLDSYPYIIAEVAPAGLSIFIDCQDSGWQRAWYVADTGKVETTSTPSFEDLKAALNLPADWVVNGRTTEEPTTYAIRYKLLPQE